LLAVGCRAAGVEVWAYCLMPNHVHFYAGASRCGRLACGVGGGQSALYASRELS
jgi:hypothetical protein